MHLCHASCELPCSKSMSGNDRSTLWVVTGDWSTLSPSLANSHMFFNSLYTFIGEGYPAVSYRR